MTGRPGLPELTPPWRRVFELAWRSWTTGGWGVGAVLVGSDGAVLAQARNRAGDADAGPRQLAGTRLAHAEINVLAAAGDDAAVGATLLTSLEPCALCAAAIAMRRVARVELAAVDPLWHGLFGAHREHPFLAGRWPERVGPLEDDLAGWSVLAEALPLSRYLRERGRGAASTHAYRAHNPGLLALAQAMADDPDASALSLDAFLGRWADRLGEVTPTRQRTAVVRLGEGDWERARDVRIAMLAESPQAFGSTMAQALAFDEQRWRERARTATTWHAVEGDRSIGSITLRADPDVPASAEITGMWVDPAARGRGAGALLVTTAVEHWRGLAGRRVTLWVVDGNAPAVGLYERCGFTPTGQALTEDGRLERQLALELA